MSFYLCDLIDIDCEQCKDTSRFSSLYLLRNDSLFLVLIRFLQRRVREATRLLVFVVCTYLLANVLMVVVSAWEYIDFYSLSTEFTLLFTYSTDIVSLLTVNTLVLLLS